MGGLVGSTATLALEIEGGQIPEGTTPHPIFGWVGGVPWDPPIVPIQTVQAIIVSEPASPQDPVVSKTGPWDTLITLGDIPQAFTITFQGIFTVYTVSFSITGFTSTVVVTPPTANTSIATAPGPQPVVSPIQFAKVTAIL